jgi:hypothetical protein
MGSTVPQVYGPSADEPWQPVVEVPMGCGMRRQASREHTNVVRARVSRRPLQEIGVRHLNTFVK